MSQKKALISALITGAAIFGFSTIASAEVPGFYAGLQAGWGQQSTNNNITQPSLASGFLATSSTTNNTSKNGFGGGVNIGWQWNDYFGTELGYLYFPNATAKASATGVNSLVQSEVNSINGTSHEQAIDLMLKGDVPFGACFGGYAKVGAAYVQNKLDLSATSSVATATGIETASISGSTTNNEIKPIASVGLTYDFTDNAVVDLSYTYLFGSAGTSSSNTITQLANSSSVARAQLIALGFTYYFGGLGVNSGDDP